MLRRGLRIPVFVAVSVLMSGCGSGAATPAPTPTPGPPGTPGAHTPAASSAPGTVLQVGIMVHLEGWADGDSEPRFKEHAQLIRDYATLFERYGAKLTLESKEVTEGSIRWGDNVLLEMQRRGHGIGVHADIGGEKTYDCSRFTDELRTEKTQLESLGITVRHVSGIVSTCDWVTAAADAGYLFTTGQVAYAVMSMPANQRPAEYRNCPTPSACHDVFPTELGDRLHPWRAENGTNWVTDSPNGRLVILPASGGLTLMDEQARDVDMKGKDAAYNQADIDAYFSELDAALALAKPNRVNTYYVSWSLGAELDPVLLEKWLQRLQTYTASGRVKWSTLPEMYDSYVAG